MQPLLDFLKTGFTSVPPENGADLFAKGVDKEALGKVNRVFSQEHLKASALPRHLRRLHPVERDQIWLLKGSYTDFVGVEQRADHPILVRVVSLVEEFGEEEFIRAQVISPFVEFQASDDWVCEDSSVLGFPFLVETWNEQPMLTELLDQYLGRYIGETVTRLGEVILSTEQREFRTLEVSRAKYLSDSITSLLYLLENRQTADSGAVITFKGESQFPQLFIGERLGEYTASLAAKAGELKEDVFLKYMPPELPFQIHIRKNEDGFVLTVTPYTPIALTNTQGTILEGLSNSEKLVYHRLPKGLYQLTHHSLTQPLNIRLK